MSSNARVLAIHEIAEIRKALREIGVDAEGIEIMGPKAIHRLIKLEDVDVRAANIIKQEMLSLAGEAAISKEAYYLKQETTDVILIGTLSHYKDLYNKLQRQPFGLRDLAEEIREVLSNYEDRVNELTVGSTTFKLDRRTHVMGILNITPDSFSDGGRFIDPSRALSHAIKMAEDGADIIDVGGESSRPGAAPVSADEEAKRVIPLIEKLSSVIRVPISIDTYKAKVARLALDAGASMVNDISALRMDAEMLSLVAKRKVPVVIMHMQGTPQNMQENPQYESVVGEISAFLRERIRLCLEAGVPRDKIIVDPGVGFGKTIDHNLGIMKHISEFRGLGYPLMLGTSRKSFIGNVLGLPVEERVEGTAATIAFAIAQGVEIMRVHDVKQMVRVAKMTNAIMRA